MIGLEWTPSQQPDGEAVLAVSVLSKSKLIYAGGVKVMAMSGVSTEYKCQACGMTFPTQDALMELNKTAHAQAAGQQQEPAK